MPRTEYGLIAEIDAGPYPKHHQSRLYTQNWLSRRKLMRRSSNIKRTDITRAAKALLAAGVHIVSVEIEPVVGKITFMTSNSSGAQRITDLDTWLAENARHT